VNPPPEPHSNFCGGRLSAVNLGWCLQKSSSEAAVNNARDCRIIFIKKGGLGTKKQTSFRVPVVNNRNLLRANVAIVPLAFTAHYFNFLRIFLGKRSEELPFDFLKLPFLSVLGFRLSVAGHPLFLLHAGATATRVKRNNKAKTMREFLIMMAN